MLKFILIIKIELANDSYLYCSLQNFPWGRHFSILQSSKGLLALIGNSSSHRKRVKINGRQERQEKVLITDLF